jgi:Fe-S cluster biogenesis protein NfuA
VGFIDPLKQLPADFENNQNSKNFRAVPQVNGGVSQVCDKAVVTVDREQIIAEIKQVLDGLLPYITSHGGSVEFLEFKDSIVFIRFYGTCLQCPLSFYTLTYGIERHIKDKVPSVLRVEAVE